jgi:antitoxin component of RelBE/YafQ-DinJ toxin-antitoxin module
MAKNSQVNIRFDEATDADLERTASRLGVSKSSLVRHLTKTFLAEVERSGSLPMNPDWTRALGTADARSGWGERRNERTEIAKVADEQGEATEPVKKRVNYGTQKQNQQSKKRK